MPAGALVTTTSLAAATDGVTVPAVTFAVAAQDAPLGLTVGDELDVWTVVDGRAEKQLDRVPVVALSDDDALEPTKSVAVAVAADQEESAVVSSAAEQVVMVRHSAAP